MISRLIARFIARFLPPANSLQRRLGLALAGAIAGLWLLATLAAGHILREEIGEVFDSALQEVAQRVLPLAYVEVLNRPEETPAGAPPELIAPVGPHREFITYIVRDAKGQVLLQSHDAAAVHFPTELAPGFVDQGGARFYTQVAIRGTLYVTAAESPGHRQRALTSALVMLVWPLLLLLPVCLIGVWLLVTRTFRPVTAFQNDIETRSGHHLDAVNAADLPAEIRPVADAVNHLLARLRRTLEAERSFTANSAHELRTPVAAALAQTQRLIAELPQGPLIERATTIETALRQLARLSEKLLQLAKAEGGGLLAQTPQDLAQGLQFVLKDLGAGTAPSRLHTAKLPAGGVLSRMDMDAFAILARNLIENALKHGDPATPVEVSLSADCELLVVNACPVIAPEVLARLTRAFERGATPAEGSGLGLAIAAAIAKGAGAQLELMSPAPGRTDGFAARVKLPPANPLA